MTQPSSAYDAHQREHWPRHDGRWIRPDAARFYKPRNDLADIFACWRKRDAEDPAAEIAKERDGRSRCATSCGDKAEPVRRRLAEAKYHTTQPGVPAGNPRGHGDRQ
jgi:hypothetical protein